MTAWVLSELPDYCDSELYKRMMNPELPLLDYKCQSLSLEASSVAIGWIIGLSIPILAACHYYRYFHAPLHQIP